MRRFKKEQYQLARNEDIIGFFSEFDNYITEDEMWALRSVYNLLRLIRIKKLCCAKLFKLRSLEEGEVS